MVGGDEMVVKSALKIAERWMNATNDAGQTIIAFLDHCSVHGINIDHAEAGRLADDVRQAMIT